MITIKYKGEIVNLKDIEITWLEENYGIGHPKTKIGTIEDYALFKYSEGYDDGCDDGYYIGIEDA